MTFDQAAVTVVTGDTWRQRWIGAENFTHEPALPPEAADAGAIQVGARIWTVLGEPGSLRLGSALGGITGDQRRTWPPGAPMVARRAHVNNHLRGVYAADMSSYQWRGQFPSVKDHLAVIGMVALWGDLRPSGGGELAADCGYPISICEIVDRRPHQDVDLWAPKKNGDPKQDFETICRPRDTHEQAVIAELRKTYRLSASITHLDADT